MKKASFLLYIFTICLMVCSCKDFLDAKPDQKLAVPKTVGQLQALLDYYIAINWRDLGAGEASADNYFVSDANFESRNEYDQRLYTWAPLSVLRESGNDWENAYANVYTANLVLERLEAVAATERTAAWGQAKGQALFLRGYEFFQLATVFCKAYDADEEDQGIPLRLGSDFNVPSKRAGLEQTYLQLLDDLEQAAALLPIKAAAATRPSREAAFALLSRVYLSRREYPLALDYADSALQLKNGLLDYNELDPSAAHPFAQFNKEVVYEGRMNLPLLLSQSRCRIVPELIDRYEGHDLRRKLYFKENADGTYTFKGSYEGSSIPFTGISVNELYLTAAECKIRAGQVEDGLAQLNGLLKMRYQTGFYVPYQGLGRQEALEAVLQERRKELLMRGLRWMDIKRLNKEGAGISLNRMVEGNTYTLPPNDPRFAIAVPDDVIRLSGIEQNVR